MEILYITTMFAIFVLCIALLTTARRILRSSPLSSGELSLSGIYDMQRPEEENANLDRTDTATSDMEESVHSVLDSAIERPFVSGSLATNPVMATWVAVESNMAAKNVAEPFNASLRAPETVIAGSVPAAWNTAEPEMADSVVTTWGAPGSAATRKAENHRVVTETVAAATIVEEPISAHSTEPADVDSAEIHAEISAEETIPAPVQVTRKNRVRKPLPRAYSHALECLLLGISVLVLVKTQRGGSRARSTQTSQHRVA